MVNDTTQLNIYRLLREAENAQLPRAQWQEKLSRWLDTQSFAFDERADVFDFAQEQAKRSALLRSDTIKDSQFESAEKILMNAAEILRNAPWYESVIENWPAPIAHELARLIDELEGVPNSDGTRQPPNPDATLLQLRDTAEVLIKLSAAIIIRSLIVNSPDDDWARRQIFRTLSGGDWARILRAGVARMPPDAPSDIRNFGAAWRREALQAVDDFVVARNDLLGHGARAINPQERAEIVAAVLLGPSYRTVEGRNRTIAPLFGLFETLYAAKAFSNLQLQTIDGTTSVSLTGAAALRQWLASKNHGADHRGPMLSVQMAYSGGVLLLSPLVAARRCLRCNRRDVFLFDSVRDLQRGKFDVLDYARGHKSRLAQAEAPDLWSATNGLMAHAAPPAGSTLNDQAILEALDRARTDRNYLSPTYLRQPLADFLTNRPSGVFWLTAPAHIGKTSFVQGLEYGNDPNNREPPITLAFAGLGKIVNYYCRKEHRTGLAGMMNRLQSQLVTTYRVSDNVRDKLPSEKDVIAARTPESFLDYLLDWQRFVVEKQLANPDDPLVIVIDGLDEVDPPPGSSPLDVLPRADALPPGLFLVLTSRPPGDDDAPAFLKSRVAPLYADGNPALVRVAITRDTPAYLELLTEYLVGRLDLRRESDAIATIIAAADQRFVYVSFLADRFETLGRDRTLHELTAAQAAGNIGPGLYQLWLDGLDRAYGQKEADRIRDLLCLLAAAEQAHDWVFSVGKRIDPASDGALTMLDDAFDGMPLIPIAAILECDQPTGDDDRLGIDPALLLTLERVQGVLRVSRSASGTTRFRIGLKDLLPVLTANPEFCAAILRAHARLACAALDTAAATKVGEQWHESAWQVAMPLLPLCEAAATLSGSVPVQRRLVNSDLLGVVMAHEQRLADKGLGVERAAWWTQAIALVWRTPVPISTLPALERRNIAALLARRGGAHLEIGYWAAALNDSDAATNLLRGLLQKRGRRDKRSMPILFDLASVLQDSGVMHAASGNRAAALKSYGEAIITLQGLPTSLERRGEWSVLMQEMLASSLQNRGITHAAGGDRAAAFNDYNAAIGIKTRLRAALERRGAWLVPMRDSLAMSLHNRAATHRAGGNREAALLDYQEAVTIRQNLRAMLEPRNEWSVPLRNELANTLQNRANIHADSGDHSAAIKDYDAAINITQGVREALEPIGEWSIPLRSNLANCLHNRAIARHSVGEQALAQLDYDEAVAIRQGLRLALEPRGEWSAPLRDDLANSLQSRGDAHRADGRLAAALKDLGEAIIIRQDLRVALEPRGEWSVPLRNNLARTLQNHAIALTAGGNRSEALKGYDAAITIRQDLRTALELRGEWSTPLDNDLANVLRNREILIGEIDQATRARRIIDTLFFNLKGVIVFWRNQHSKIKSVLSRWYRRL